jgi:regulator of sigma E protease
MGGFFTSLPMIAIGLLTLSIVVFIHELGHFLLAKWNGIGVLEFSVGFGRKIFRKKYGDTYYSIGLIPLGGYVRMIGDDPRNLHTEASLSAVSDSADDTDPVQRENEKQLDESLFYGLPLDALDKQFLNNRSKWFLTKGYWAKMAVVFAGPAFNLISAVLISWFVVYQYGIPSSSDETKVGSVFKGQPAYEAGIKPGDKVITVDGQVMSDWKAFAEYVSKVSEHGVTIVVERKAALGDMLERHEIKVKGVLEPIANALLRGDEDSKRFLIGIGPSMDKKEFVGVGESLLVGTQSVCGLAVIMVRSLGWMLSGKVGSDSVSGPIAIVSELGKAAERGFEDLLSFVVMISVCLAVMNLLPIPVLDGGHLVFFTLEKIIGRPINLRVQEMATQVGLFLLLGLMVFAMGNDLFKIVKPMVQ